MTQPSSDAIELRRAQRGPDLWAAIEAAQYARLVDYDAPRTDEEAARMADLIGLFSECSEEWESRNTSDQKLVLEQLDVRLSALGELGLFVYSGIAQRRLKTAEGAPVELPVAVLVIRRDDRPTVAIGLPAAIDID
jgi:hypothetical protein